MCAHACLFDQAGLIMIFMLQEAGVVCPLRMDEHCLHKLTDSSINPACLCKSAFLFVCLLLCVLLCLSASPPMTLHLCLSLHLCESLSLCLTVCLSLSLSLCISVC